MRASTGVEIAKALIVVTAVLVIGGTGLAGRTLRGSGHVVSETRTVRGFDAVELSGVGELTITQGRTESLRIEAEDNLLPAIYSRVEHDTLRLGIETPEGWHGISPRRPVRYALQVRDLSRLALHGTTVAKCTALHTPSLSLEMQGATRADLRVAADSLETDLEGSSSATLVVTSRNESGEVGDCRLQASGASQVHCKDLRARALSLHLSGSSEAEVGLTVGALEARLSGASMARLSGLAPRQTVEISGSSRYRAAELASTTCRLEADGAADAAVNVREKLDVHAGGSAHVVYKGSPAVESDLSGSSRLRRLS